MWACDDDGDGNATGLFWPQVGGSCLYVFDYVALTNGTKIEANEWHTRGQSDENLYYHTGADKENLWVNESTSQIPVVYRRVSPFEGGECKFAAAADAVVATAAPNIIICQ